MKSNKIVTPSSQIDSTLPLWIRSPDVVMADGVRTEYDGRRLTREKYRSKSHKNFVNFMTKSMESEERIGFGANILQNLLDYRDFDTYTNKITEYDYLDQNLEEDEIDSIILSDGYGFPDENGVISINDEVILYRRKEGNVLYNLERGASATTILPTYRSRGTYVRTEPGRHNREDKVVNLSVLFLVSMLDTIHRTYAHGIDSSRVAPEINRSSLLQNIKDFFRAKGSKLGIKALFKILFAENDVEVFYPGDRMIKPSVSTWSESLIVRTVPIPFVLTDQTDNYTTPENIIGSEVTFKSYLDDKVYARSICDYTSTYQWEGTTQYEIVLNKDEFEGDTPVNTVTYLTRKLFLARAGAPVDERDDTTTITVESTLGFPDEGVVFIDQEAVYYTEKTTNQFLNCHRGYIGVNAEHAQGSKVYGPYYVETEIIDKDGVPHVSRSWPLGLVESVQVKDPGLLHQLDDKILVNNETGKDMPGRLDPREAILCTANLFGQIQYTFRENYQDNLVNQVSDDPEFIAYYGDRTYGPDGIYFDDDHVFCSASGFPEHLVGLFNTTGVIPDDELVGSKMSGEHIVSIIPRREIIKTNISGGEYIEESKGTDTIGVFVDGVRAFSNISPNIVKSGKVGHFVVHEGGSGYKNPTVLLTPNNSQGEAVIDPVDGSIISVTPSSDGVYIDDPLVRVTSGEGAKISASFDRYGRITNLSIQNRGEYYNDVPIITAVDATGRGKGALLGCKVVGGRIASVEIVNSGIDYHPAGTTILVTPIGKGAVVSAVTEYYSFDRHNEVIANNYWQFDEGNGFLYEQQPGRTRSLYGYVCDPIKLRDYMNDVGSEHSPIVGWAFDGNPIYGPHGFANNVDDTDGLARQSSGYRLRTSRLGIIPGGTDTVGNSPPSLGEYPMGTFVEDYEYNPWAILGLPSPVPPPQAGYLANEDPKYLLSTGEYDNYKLEVEDGEDDGSPPTEVLPNYMLDELNGKICNTPEFPKELYPDGVYCYFLSTDDTETTKFPYIIGKTFHDRPLPQDKEFDYNLVERLRNPYLTSTRRDLKVEIEDISSGSIDRVIVENGGPDTNMIGDYLYFDDFDTGGAGAQGIVSALVGKTVISGSSDRVTTKIVSHRQLVDFTNNLDEDNLLESFQFVKDKEFTTFSLDNYARSNVEDYDARFWEMKCQTSTIDLIKENDKFYDHARKLGTVGKVGILPELKTTKKLWLESTDHLEVGDLLEIDNGSLDEEYIENEVVRIDQIHPDNFIVVTRAIQEDPQDIEDLSEVYMNTKFLYQLQTDSKHYVVTGDTIFISGSENEELNGPHTIIDWNEDTMFFYVSKKYDAETNLTYTTTSEASQGVVSEIRVTSPGYGYESLPVIVGIDKKHIDRAETKINLNGSRIGSVDVRFGGIRYVNPKAVFFDYSNSGFGAEADVSVVNGQVDKITVTDPGNNYIDPVVYLIEQDGKYIPSTKDIGKIKSVKVINPGRNISADRSLKPELSITTRLVVKYSEGSPKFKVGDTLYQGTYDLRTAFAYVYEYDDERQIVSLNGVTGFINDQEKVYSVSGVEAFVEVEGQADCRIVVDSVSKPEGDFIDDTSKLSEWYPVLQDSYRFQWFSYVIASPIQQIEYDTFVKKIIHPAGFIQFADLSVHDDVTTTYYAVDSDPFESVDNLDPLGFRPLLISQQDDTPLVVVKDTSDYWVDTGINT